MAATPRCCFRVRGIAGRPGPAQLASRYGLHAIAIVRSAPPRTTAVVALRSHRAASADECSPSKPIVPVRRLWLPDDATAAEAVDDARCLQSGVGAILS